MGIVSEAGVCPPTDATILGAILQGEPGRFHCGLLVNDDNGGYKLVHFAWHFRLLAEPFECDYYVFRVGLDKLNQPSVAALCLEVVERNAEKIPYGFNYLNLEFNVDSGEIEGLQVGDGMTCASFVYTIFKSLGFLPVDLVDWPEDASDAAWRDYIVGLLTIKGASAEHIAAIDMEKPHVRLRPSQIIAAISVDQVEWPLHSEEVLPISVALELQVPV